MNLAELSERFDTIVAMVRLRLEGLGIDPSTVLVVSREQLKLSAVAVPGVAVSPFTMYLRTALQSSAPLEHVAERFIAGWQQAKAEAQGK